MNLPSCLYHGSAFQQSELMPGYMRSGNIVRWDKTESNEWLYASSEKETALVLGLASAAEKKWHIERFSHVGTALFFHFDSNEHVRFDDLLGLDLFVYEFEPKQEHQWIKNSNLHNNIETEWKTKETIKDFRQVTKVDIGAMIKRYHVHINNHPVHKTNVAFLNW